jgi:site-specific DNA-methyltransferase (adenine-specific)
VAIAGLDVNNPRAMDDSWSTPTELFSILNDEFNFTLDAAASDLTAKCKKYYTQITDGLKHSWEGEVVFCNPPYNEGNKTRDTLRNWVEKCFRESLYPNTKVVALIPASVDTTYFHDFIWNKAEVRFIKGRVRFFDAQGNRRDSPPFASMVAIWGEGVTPTFFNAQPTIVPEMEMFDD